MEFEFLSSLVIIFGVSAFVVYLLNRLKIPSVVGFLISGIIIGPYGIALIRNTRSVEIMAEIGIILLLFTIGIEFSVANLSKMKKTVIVGGGTQVFLTITLSAVIAYWATGNIYKSIFLGFIIALSSTAIVLKMLSEKGAMDSPHGRIMTGILIFQDLCVVPLMLLTPVLSGEEVNYTNLLLKLGKAIMIIGSILFTAKWVVPKLLHQVVSSGSRELFMTVIILLCLGIPLLTSSFGLSLSLGAFLAGLAISESEYAHQATADILPFKNSFIGLFFVSVGMLMDFGYMTHNLSKIIITVVSIFLLKFVTGTASALMIGTPLRTSMHSALGIFQIGEFSFVLAIAGKELGIISEEFYQLFLSSSVVTMIATPFIMTVAPSVSGWIASRPFLRGLTRLKKIPKDDRFPRKKEGHVIIIGFGLNGRNLARVLKESEISYVILEMNSDTVREKKHKGEPIYYGDGTSQEILHKLGIEKARLLVVAISDPASTRRIVSTARLENRELYIIVRTKYVAEVDDLKALGADEVIPEEFETSIEIFSRVLKKYNFGDKVIQDMIVKIRQDSYTALRKGELQKSHLFENIDLFPEIEVEGYPIPADSHLIGKNMKDLELRKKFGITVMAVRRGTEVVINPVPEFTFSKGDIVLITGESKNMTSALNYFKSEI